jgi:toxin YhaV
MGENTKRAYESGDDAHLVFRKMVKAGRPPDGWDQLLTESQAAATHLKEVTTELSGPATESI